MTVLLKNIDDVVLVFGEYLGEAVGLFDRFHRLLRLLILRIVQHGCIEDVRTHPELPGGFLCDGQLIAGNHFDFHAHLHGVRDGRFGFWAGRIEHRQHAHKLPLIFLIRPRHAQGTESAPGEFVDGFLDSGLHIANIGRHR